MTEIVKQQIQELRLKGTGYKAIAAVLGISRDSVRGMVLMVIQRLFLLTLRKRKSKT